MKIQETNEEPNTIVFYAPDGIEMLKIEPGKFTAFNETITDIHKLYEKFKAWLDTTTPNTKNNVDEKSD